MKGVLSMKMDLRSWFAGVHPQAEQDKRRQKEELCHEIQELLLQMRVAQSHFDQETDFALIESHILQLKALEMRYKNALCRAKELRLCAFDLPAESERKGRIPCLWKQC